ncbi:MAG TPA: hypothetical protein VM325_03320 [Alphaproteobacteria bacterium]|nr:hypothetical protein [Alphaproteobacteria bacterium]
MAVNTLARARKTVGICSMDQVPHRSGVPSPETGGEYRGRLYRVALGQIEFVDPALRIIASLARQEELPLLTISKDRERHTLVERIFNSDS